MTEQELERFEHLFAELIRLSYDMSHRLGVDAIYDMPKLYEKCKEQNDDESFDYCTLFEMIKRGARTISREDEREFGQTIPYMPFEYDLKR